MTFFFLRFARQHFFFFFSLVSVQPSEFVEQLMQSLPAVRDHVIILEQHAIESARVAGRLHKQNKEACAKSFIYDCTLFLIFTFFSLS
jgi:hypothetical protein